MVGRGWGGGRPIFALLDGLWGAENERMVLAEGRVWGSGRLGVRVRGMNRVGNVMVEEALEIMEGPMLVGGVVVEHEGGFATEAESGRTGGR